MNQCKKNEIARLQNEGLGYKKISDALGLPINTIKSFCYRNPIKSKQVKHFCKQCGVEIVQQPNRKEKKFCSDACRMKWWNSRLEQVNHKVVNQLICPSCCKRFESYGKRIRKFCSRACYGKFRMKVDK